MALRVGLRSAESAPLPCEVCRFLTLLYSGIRRASAPRADQDGAGHPRSSKNGVKGPELYRLNRRAHEIQVRLLAVAFDYSDRKRPARLSEIPVRLVARSNLGRAAGAQVKRKTPSPAVVRSRVEPDIAFLAYCLHVTLARRLHALAPGLTPRNVLEKFAAMQMIDVNMPTTDGRELVLTLYTEPEPQLSLNKLKLELPAQPPPKITAAPAGPISL
jgi:hypothetical protein